MPSPTFSTLAEFLKHHDFPANLPNNGVFHRFTGKHPTKANGFYKGVEYTYGDKLITRVIAGEWGVTRPQIFESDTGSLTEEEKSEFSKRRLEQDAEWSTLLLAKQDEVSEECLLTFSDGITRGTTPYLERKGLSSLHGARIDPDAPDVLLVPARDASGKLWSLQRIFPDGSKRFASGGRKRGCFHTLNDGAPTGSATEYGLIFVSEGYATAGSIAEAFPGHLSVCAFDTGGLKPVGEALRALYPHALLRFAADNDESGAGLVAALAAARGLPGSQVTLAYPKEGSDFNDVHTSLGLPAVAAQLLVDYAPPPPPPEAARAALPVEAEELYALPRTLNEKGKPQKPFQQRVADALVAHYGNSIVKYGESDVFIYQGTHWELAGPREHSMFHMQIRKLAGIDFTSGELDGCMKLFLKSIPSVPSQTVDGDQVPLNMFEPRRDCANFRNGTLHLRRRYKSQEELSESPGSGAELLWTEFLPHDREDFLTNVLPMAYKPEEELETNESFEAMLKGVWPEEDFEDKAWLYREILGAALIPEHPMMFFFIGAPQSGKSTLIMLVSKLLGGKNVGSVDPSEWGQRFALHNLLGKLANIDTYISTTGRIADSIAKKVIDGRVMVDRKNQTAIAARMPTLHLFGGNAMPKSFEKGSGAYDRRAIIVRTSTRQVGYGGGGGFSDWVWNRGPEGVLKAALQGLARLLANGGKFTVPASSKIDVTEWQSENDFVGQFIESVEHNEVKFGQGLLQIGEELTASKAGLYEAFKEWMDANAPDTKIPSQKLFTQRVKVDARFKEQRTMNCRMWSGLGGVER